MLNLTTKTGGFQNFSDFSIRQERVVGLNYLSRCLRECGWFGVACTTDQVRAFWGFEKVFRFPEAKLLQLPLASSYIPLLREIFVNANYHWGRRYWLIHDTQRLLMTKASFSLRTGIERSRELGVREGSQLSCRTGMSQQPAETGTHVKGLCLLAQSWYLY